MELSLLPAATACTWLKELPLHIVKETVADIIEITYIYSNNKRKLQTNTQLDQSDKCINLLE